MELKPTTVQSKDRRPPSKDPTFELIRSYRTPVMEDRGLFKELFVELGPS